MQIEQNLLLLSGLSLSGLQLLAYKFFKKINKKRFPKTYTIKIYKKSTLIFLHNKSKCFINNYNDK